MEVESDSGSHAAPVIPSKTDSLFEEIKKQPIPWGPIGETVFKRSYSQHKADGSKETWPETVIRAVRGNLTLVDSKFIEEDEEEKLIRLIFPFGALPAGRHLSASGRKGRQFLFNCHASGWDGKDPAQHFTFLFDSLMQGGGVGANYSNRYIEKLPTVTKMIDLHLVCREDHPNLHEFRDLLCAVMQGDSNSHTNKHVVEDSREGWVEAFRQVLMTAWKDPVIGGPNEERIVIDVSNIRQRGALLKTSGGIACGPKPLVKMLSNLVKHLNGCYMRKMHSLDAMLIDHIVADCVVAGGKRRSSRMSVKNWRDYDIFEFINCKLTDGAHWTTNISVEIDDDFKAAYRNVNHEDHQHAKAVLRAVVTGTQANGEPGLWDIDLAREGEREPEKMYCPNPCGEICLNMWENCNLAHVNLEYFASKPPAKMREAFRLMTRWAIRATFGDIPNEKQREVVHRNRRIGIGFFGYHNYLSLQGIRYSEAWKNFDVIKMLNQARNMVETEAQNYSDQLGIPVPVKNTTLAPTGSTAPMPGSSTSAQTIEDPYFIRRVRYADTDPELHVKKVEGYPCYPDSDSQNTTIVEYWCENPIISKMVQYGLDPSIVEGQKDVSVENYLQTQAVLQEVWADNSISFTIPLSEKNAVSEEELEKLLASVIGRVKGTTMYPDRSRKNSPFESLTKEQFDSYTGRKEVTQVEVECKNGCPTN